MTGSFPSSLRPQAMRRSFMLITAGGKVFRTCNDGVFVARPNYHQVKKQKELARKARQQSKMQRRSDKVPSADESAPAASAPGPLAPTDLSVGTKT